MNITRTAIPAALLAAAGAVAVSAPVVAETPETLRETTSNSISAKPAGAKKQSQEASLTFVSGSIDFGYEEIDILKPIPTKNDTLSGTAVDGKTFKPRPFQDGQDWEANSIFMDETNYQETILTGLEIATNPKTGEATVKSGFLSNAGASAFLTWHDYSFTGDTQMLDLSGLPATVDPDGSVTVEGTQTSAQGAPYTVKLHFKLNIL